MPSSGAIHEMREIPQKRLKNKEGPKHILQRPIVSKKVNSSDVRLKKCSEIAIIGSGLSALSCALSLLSCGFVNISLYERDSYISDRRDGYGLTLTYNPKGPLASLGILEDVAQKDCPSRSHYEFDPQGYIRGYFGNEFTPHRGEGQRGNLRVPRQVLREMMINELAKRSSDIPDSNVEIHWGKKLAHYETIPATDNQSSQQRNDHDVHLYFEDGSKAFAKLLIGADGINSTVATSLLQPLNDVPKYSTIATKTSKSYIGVMIILGITNTDFYHPLLDERGFHTMDGTNRLFTMPFEGSNLSDILNRKRKRRIMWQLSFSMPNFSEAQKLSQSDPNVLLEEVKRRIIHWHSPISIMLDSTPLETVWGTPLQDRDPQHVLDAIQKTLYPSSNRHKNVLRTVLVGDSIHPMSPFKGQGANQALSDGPLLASWLTKANIDSAVRGFQREMVQRSKTKVYSSREAALNLHIKANFLSNETWVFAGVRDSNLVPKLLNSLKERNIGAHLAGKLDGEVGTVISELGLVEQGAIGHMNIDDEIEKLAINLTARGNLPALRQLSLRHGSLLNISSKESGETCLHIAAINGHHCICKWLLQAANTKISTLISRRDKLGRSVLHSALLSTIDCKHIENTDICGAGVLDGNAAKISMLLAALSVKYSNAREVCWGKDKNNKSSLDYAAVRWGESSSNYMRLADIYNTINKRVSGNSD